MKALLVLAALGFTAGCSTTSPAPAPAAQARPAAVASADGEKKVCRMTPKVDKTGVGGAGSFDRVCMTKAEWDRINKVDEAHKRDMARAIDTAVGNGATGGGNP